jgi:hypothetical protein
MELVSHAKYFSKSTSPAWAPFDHAQGDLLASETKASLASFSKQDYQK